MEDGNLQVRAMVVSTTRNVAERKEKMEWIAMKCLVQSVMNRNTLLLYYCYYAIHTIASMQVELTSVGEVGQPWTIDTLLQCTIRSVGVQ